MIFIIFFYFIFLSLDYIHIILNNYKIDKMLGIIMHVVQSPTHILKDDYL
jgi:hypothetical protein